MALPFAKYHGAGNDFVLVDDRRGLWRASEAGERIARLCDRHVGIGADGLIYLRADADGSSGGLRMVYYNADGAPSSFCGNGSRCFVAFAARLGLAEPGVTFRFLANDGPHSGRLEVGGQVSVSMRIAGAVERLTERDDRVDTGSPHFVRWSRVLPQGDITEAAREVRYGGAYAKTGINVNYVTRLGDAALAIRTYERGVEGETLACGTGVTAAALSYADRERLTGRRELRVEARGGVLGVSFERSAEGLISDVWLSGPAEHVFDGTLSDD